MLNGKALKRIENAYLGELGAIGIFCSYPALWKTLLSAIHQAVMQSVASEFKRLVKAYLFAQAFPGP